MAHQVKLNFEVDDAKVEIISAQMSGELQQEAIKAAKRAMAKYSGEEETVKYNGNAKFELATNIKRDFDRKYGGTWHCFTGLDFLVSVTPVETNSITFKVGQILIALFKAKNESDPVQTENVGAQIVSQEEMAKIAKQALSKYKKDKAEIIKFVKNEFEKKLGGTWGCLIGFDFFSSLTQANSPSNIKIGFSTLTLFKT